MNASDLAYEKYNDASLRAAFLDGYMSAKMVYKLTKEDFLVITNMSKEFGVEMALELFYNTIGA